jgi:hypothetical protein
VFSGALAHLHITRLWELGAYVAIITAISSAIYLTALRKPASDELRDETGASRSPKNSAS